MKFRFVFLLIGVILLTQIRGGLLLIMPFVPWLLYKLQHYKVDKKRFSWIVSLFVLSSIVGLYRGTTEIENTFLSAWLLLPILYLFFAEPYTSNRKNTFKDYFKATQFVLIIVDLIGFSVWVRHGGDEMGTAYGRHYEYVHGLAMVNAMYVSYYIAKVRKKDFHKKDLVPLSIMALSFVFCDFGLGQLTVFATIIIMLFLERRFKYLIVLGLVLTGAVMVYKSDSFEYNRENIDLALTDQENARKTLMFSNTIELLQEDPGVDLFGAGPGGYNSRTELLLSGNNDNYFTSLLGSHEPKYYRKYIWPLWNSSFVSMDSFSDGTRNKPYSSIIALIVEYGWLFAFIVIMSWIGRIRRNDSIQTDSTLKYFILILDVFMLVACFVHEWLVTSEFIVYILLRFFATKQIKIDGSQK